MYFSLEDSLIDESVTLPTCPGHSMFADSLREPAKLTLATAQVKDVYHGKQQEDIIGCHPFMQDQTYIDLHLVKGLYYILHMHHLLLNL